MSKPYAVRWSEIDRKNTRREKVREFGSRSALDKFLDRLREGDGFEAVLAVSEPVPGDRLSAESIEKGDVIEVDRFGEARNGDDVCRVVRGPKKVGGEFVLYVVPSTEPAEGDELAWANGDVEELPAAPHDTFRLVSRKK